MKFNYKKILPWVLFAIVVIGIGAWLIYRFTGEKSLELISPNGNEIWQANETYQITWRARNIGKIGIMLIKEKTPKESEWIVKDLAADKRRYDLQIFAWQEPRQDYRIAIVEYPWYEGNEIDYSDKYFTILGPTIPSCDKLSIEAEWSHLPSDFPNLRKVFITRTNFGGNLGGLEGADQKCQQEAEREGFEGTWRAFLGDETTLAVERLNLEGIFVEAHGQEVLPQVKIPAYFWESFSQFLRTTKLEERRSVVEDADNLLEKYFGRFLLFWENQQDKKTCHRLLGKNFDEFFQKLSDPLMLNQEKFGYEFLKDLADIWLGRVNQESKRDCITIFTRFPHRDPALNHSFTTTCHNWTMSIEKIPGYLPDAGETIGELPVCYTPAGVRINSAGLAGLSAGITEITDKVGEKFFSPALGKPCNLSQKLLCIQQ